MSSLFKNKMVLQGTYFKVKTQRFKIHFLVYENILSDI